MDRLMQSYQMGLTDTYKEFEMPCDISPQKTPKEFRPDDLWYLKGQMKGLKEILVKHREQKH